MAKLIIAGSRSLHRQFLSTWLLLIVNGIHKNNLQGKFDKIIHGNCTTGPDKFAQDFVELYDIPVERYPAEWDKHGKQAGMIRNSIMAHAGDMLLAFWDGQSPGTANMIDVMKALNKPVYVELIDETYRPGQQLEERLLK